MRYNSFINFSAKKYMKKLFPFLLLFFILTGCSNIQLEAVSTSEEETQRILALGLTHEENLKEAKKLKSNHMVSVVTLQLINAHDEKIQAEIDLIESNKYADLVIVSNNNLKFIAPELVKRIKTGVLETDVDTQTLQIRGNKSDNGLIDHTLTLKIEHISLNKRSYLSANLCDSWGRCDGNPIEFKLLSSNSSNCTSSACDQVDVFEFYFSDEFLRNKLNEAGFTDGLTMRINRKRFSNKVNVPTTYLEGYLKVAN